MEHNDSVYITIHNLGEFTATPRHAEEGKWQYAIKSLRHNKAIEGEWKTSRYDALNDAVEKMYATEPHPQEIRPVTLWQIIK